MDQLDWFLICVWAFMMLLVFVGILEKEGAKILEEEGAKENRWLSWFFVVELFLFLFVFCNLEYTFTLNSLVVLAYFDVILLLYSRR